MKKALCTPLAVALAAAMTVAGCASSSRTTESTGQYVDDATITSEVKAALLGDSGLKSFEISARPTRTSSGSAVSSTATR